jgi:putative tricarboxylic transport membrane protein
MADRILGVGIFILGGALLYATAQLEDPPLVDPLGIRTFPAVVAIGALIAGALLLFEKYREQQNQSEKEGQTVETKNRPLAAGAVLGWMLLMYILLETLGFAVSIALMLFGLMAFFNRGKWIINAAVSVLFSIGFYFVFTKLIGVPLPRGFWAL